MAVRSLLLGKRLVLNKYFKAGQLGNCIVRLYWNKDWKHGPYPKTPEERAAAAKKYGLLPEDYEPYPEEACLGDYPNLPPVSADSKNPYVAWDNPSLKRNFGEPFNLDYDLYGEDRIDVNARYQIPLWKQFFIFTGVMTVLYIIFQIGQHYPMHPAIMPKQLPAQGVKHYTFEKKGTESRAH